MKLDRRWVDGAAIGLLLAISIYWTVAHLRGGISYSPDSGLYLYQSAQLSVEGSLKPVSILYPPLFPALVGTVSLLTELFPGDAAIVVLAGSVAAMLAGTFVLLRLVGAGPVLALAWAGAIFTVPTTQYVLGFAWTEAPLIALTVLALLGLALYAIAQHHWALWLLIACGSLLPLMKYAAFALTATLAAALGAWWFSERRPVPKLLQVYAALALPTACYMLYNYLTFGKLTGHPPAQRLWDENLRDLRSSIQTSLPLGLLSAPALATMALLARRPRSFLRHPAVPVATAGVLLALAYTTSLLVRASLAETDRLDERLAAPVVALCVLAAALIAALAAGLEPHRRLNVALQTVLVLIVVFCTVPTWKATARTTHQLGWGPKATSLAPFEAGFFRTTTAPALSRFLSKRAENADATSIVFVEAKPGYAEKASLTHAQQM